MSACARCARVYDGAMSPAVRAVSIITCWLGLVAACDSSDTPRPPRVPEVREFILDGPAREGSSELIDGSELSHRQLLDRLDDVVKQPKVKGVFLRVSGFGGAWGRTVELHEALQRIRDAKKPVHCHFDNTDNSGYALLASSCDRISMSPTGMLALTGVRAQVVYARDLLDTIGVQAELLQVGRFKGAADSLTRADMPAEVREVLSRLLDDLQAHLATAVKKGRSLDAASFDRAVNEGPYASNEALRRRLIDAITFDDEARAKAKAAASAERVTRVPAEQAKRGLELGDLWKALFHGERHRQHGERIALAYLDGSIHDSQRDTASGAASGPFVRDMRRIADDKAIRALVLRIDSPGGSALASDKMWHAVRRVAKRKPVIVSIGDMAASGGYYVACAGSEIFADDESIVGSIGVVGGKIVGERLADRLGVHAVTLNRGQNAGWTNPFKPFSDSERRSIQLAMDHTYQTFLSRVREGRKLDGERLAAVAEGRIMTGKRAREGGLVDTAGGLAQALARARSKAGLAADAPLEVWQKEHSLFGMVSEVLMGADSSASALPAALTSHSASALPAALTTLTQSVRLPLLAALLNQDASPLAALPYGLDLD